MTAALDRHRALLAAATPGKCDFTHNARHEESRIYIGNHVRALLDGRVLGNEVADAEMFAAAVNAYATFLDLWAAAKDMHAAAKRLDPDTYKVDDNYVLRIGGILAKLEAMQ